MRKQRLNDTFRHLFKTVATLLEIPVAEVEEFVLDDGKVRSCFLSKT